jgi:hypothetical protein
MPNDVIGPRMFHSPGGIIQIQYKSDKGSDFDEESRVSATDGSELSFHMVEIVFTAYQGALSMVEFFYQKQPSTRNCS